MKIFAKIRFYYGAFIITFIAAGVMVPLMFIFKNRRNKILHGYNALIIKLMGGKIETKGVRDNSADMFVMNHQGIIDIVAMEAAQLTDMRWIAKRQLFDTPWFGYLLKLPNMVNVDRENKTGLIKLIRDAKETKEAEKHRTLAIFPEGTRTDKQELRVFKGGAKMVAEKLKLKIQPVIITNSKKLLNEHNKTAHSATVHIEYLDTFIANRANKDWYKNLQETMQKAIDHEKNNNERYR
ncbi:1-acyl-sn-glycerol-3-phosphate acyltransferase [Sulfurovum sp. bin170]|uniref:lysophospholipid acyltransferase family protein n=1 Tax=Sulfurovum sp. bin170 TaxID=2695268 RepID=UPI0013DF587C|nr:lysophospholipid acyltransferase family protein [Sulfurovum sp. bin170]NEW60190.1 1-acyl-sn-glycerol-3-phosphate acyltransferase [Sulfurovum sp. bin170]